MAVAIISFLILWSFILAKTSYAAFTLNTISPTTITSADSEITLNASATNLTSDTQYFQVALTKSGQSVNNYFGFTKNNSDQWVAYQTTPILSNLLKITPVGGIWTGQVIAKIDTSDSGFKGNGDYDIKLFKYISSASSHSDSNSLTLTVNTSSNTNTTSSSQDTSSQSPSIDWSSVTTANIGETFASVVSLSNFGPKTDYYLKMRGGLTDNELNKMQTENSGSYFSDTDSWSSFPTITTDDSGHWSGTINGRLDLDKSPGDYLVRIRAKKITTTTLIDSDPKTIKFNKPVSTGVTSNSVTSSNDAKTTSSGSELNQSTGVVLSASTSGTATDSPTATVNLGTTKITTADKPPETTEIAGIHTPTTADLPSFPPYWWVIIGLAGSSFGMLVILKYWHGLPE